MAMIPFESSAGSTLTACPPVSASGGATNAPHCPTSPFAPHVCPLAQPPQSSARVTPQLSFTESGPQVRPAAPQSCVWLSATQPQTLGVPPPPQARGAVQLAPQLTVRATPQLSAALTEPQFLPSRLQKAASLSLGQAHWLAMPAPPQVWGAVQAPQLATVRMRPQLSVAVTAPQTLPCRVQNAASVSGAQPHWLAVPAPPQV
jgi:hypothetical protein